MPFAERPGCTVVLLAPPADAGVTGDAVDAATLDALLDAAGTDARLEVFCPLPGVGALPVRARAHPPLDDLGAALRAIGPRKPGRDVAWIVAGTRTPPTWLGRLRIALRADRIVGTVSPLCVGDPWFSPFDTATHPAVADAALDAWLDANASDAPVQMPAPLVLCGVMRGDAADAIAHAEAGADWALTVSQAGYVHAACAAVAARAPAGWAAHAARVAHADAAGRGAGVAPDTARFHAVADPGAGASLLGLLGLGDLHPLQHVRRHLAAALAANALVDAPAAPDAPETPADDPPARPPVRLHVAHSWGGGLGAWVSDFCRADEDHDGLVLRSIGAFGAFGQRIALYHGTDPTTPLRVWELDLPIHATAIAHLQYRAILQEIVADFGVDSIIVSSMIGHSLDILRSSLPTLVVAHDHTPFCIAIFAYFGDECRSCDATRLRSCIDENPGHRFFRGAKAEDWIALRRAFVDTVLQRAIPIVAPSPSTAARWRSLMPELANARIEVIPHGVDLPPAVPFAPPADGRLRLVKIGRISPEKGGAVLEAALPELTAFADLTLIGCGDEAKRLGRHRGVTTIATFEHDELPALVARARPHLGLQLSTVPETFSYTLSEMWHCGVPVLGCRTGSLADRIREGENGFLCEPNVASLLARLRELDGRRADLAAMRPRLLEAPQRTCAQMVADYRALVAAPARRAPARAPRVPVVPPPARVRVGAVSVDPEVTYGQAMRAFARYTLRKAANSPRLPASVRRIVAAAARRRARARAPH